MQEIWRDISGYENYQVSNLGNVRSLNYNHTGKMKLMKTVLVKGYYKVKLFDSNRVPKLKSVHRLVYEAFNGKIPDGLVINHKDEVTINNRLENLEAVSQSHNINYGTRNFRVSEKMTNGKLSRPVLQINKDTGDIIKEYPSAMEASRQTGIANATISKCALGSKGYKSAGGYIWKYK